MNSATRELLEQHFDTAFAAPDGVKKLRELILTLAMQGKLVPQDPDDPPASHLLKEIEAEKSRLWRDGKIKAPKALPEIAPAEMPYALPQGWEWVRLGEIGVWKSGSTPSRNNSNYYGGNIPWVKSGEVKQGHIAKTEELITELALNECSLSLNPVGSVLVAMYGANIGEVGILDIEAATNQAVCACRTYTAFDERYLLNLIESLKPYFISQGAGAAQPNISREKIVATPFPLPPLPEQHRIVAKIDQLMARCDELERLRTEREQKRRSVHTAALKQLLDAQAAASIADAWQFISRHFGDLYAVKENVAELRKAILQLAVIGKLVPQNPNDEPASALLKRIAQERAQREANGVCKKSKSIPPTGKDKEPFILPKGWEWSCIADLTQVLNGRAYSKEELLSSGTPVLRVGNLFTSNHWYYSDLELEPDKYCDVGDLIFSWSASFGPFVWQGPRVIYHYHIWKLALFDDTSLAKEFLYKFLLEKTEEIKAAGHGVSMVHMTKEKMEKIPVPIPPLPEQHRIVAKVDQLMALCDTLEQHINAATGKQTELLDALMAPV